VEILFSPKQDRVYSMQFPITVKHNTETCYITVKGSGSQLRVTFDPSELVLPPITPFSEASEATVRLGNPTDYPLEIMAPQFDLQTYLEHLMRAEKALEPPKPVEEEIPTVITLTQTSVSKFSVVVIIHGPSISGRTTVSRGISAYLGDLPIVSLKEVWKDLLNKADVTQADFVSALQLLITTNEYSQGFVIDGLDVLNEPNESDQFLSHAIRQKNSENELQKNPFAVFAHQPLTSSEQALAYVLAAVDGHYVFMIA
jgi:hydrocephalus-inducing protein